MDNTAASYQKTQNDSQESKIDINQNKQCGKTMFCKHSGTCLSNTISCSVNAFMLAFMVKFAVNLILIFLKKFQGKLPIKKMLISLWINTKNQQFPLFIFLYCIIMKGSLCLLRRIRNKDDGLNAFISGFLAGLALVIERKENRYLWKVYLANRVFEMMYLSLANKGVIKRRTIYYTYVYMISSFMISYAFFMEPIIIKKDMFKLYQFFSNNTHNDQIWHWCNVLAHDKRESKYHNFSDSLTQQ